MKEKLEQLKKQQEDLLEKAGQIQSNLQILQNQLNGINQQILKIMGAIEVLEELKDWRVGDV